MMWWPFRAHLPRRVPTSRWAAPSYSRRDGRWIRRVAPRGCVSPSSATCSTATSPASGPRTCRTCTTTRPTGRRSVPTRRRTGGRSIWCSHEREEEGGRRKEDVRATSARWGNTCVVPPCSFLLPPCPVGHLLHRHVL